MQTLLCRQMRQFFASVRAMVSKKYPDSQVKAVGSFLFLRFLCPSIFSPDGFGLVAGKLIFLDSNGLDI